MAGLHGAGPNTFHKINWAPSPNHFLVSRLDQPKTSGEVGRALFVHVDAQRIVRVAQPRSFVTGRGNPAGAENQGRLFLGYLLLAKQKKVTCCRATPGGIR